MTELATRPPAAEDDDETFDASAYDLPIPKMDGRRATKLNIRFSGSGSLDRTSEDDLELLKAMRLGQPVRLIVTGSIGSKAFNLAGSDDGDLVFACTVRVASVEAGEIARRDPPRLQSLGKPLGPGTSGARRHGLRWPYLP